jgi:catechol 2,3-dioxygenase-like lactoylglutathione lyase family enzyme
MVLELEVIIPPVTFLICGIQQVGVGVVDLAAELRWCRSALGIDVRIFDDEGEAALMLPYTGGAPQARRAVLVASLQGGSGLEVWHYSRRAPVPAGFEPLPGDLGITTVFIKSRDPRDAHARLSSAGVPRIGSLTNDPAGDPCFVLRDPQGLPFRIGTGKDWFVRGKHPTAGVAGCMIGVRDVDRSLPFYRDILGYDQVVYDHSGAFDDLSDLGARARQVRRLLLARSGRNRGAFSPLLGSSRLELVQALDRAPRKIFAGRFWGDPGFIHLCFDVVGMDALKARCAFLGHSFTVDSGQGLSMGDAAGRFAYVEDPDGTLVEFVETWRLPVMGKWGIAVDLRRRPAGKPLPRLMLRALGLNRVKV